MGGRHPKWALRGPDCDCGECSRRYIQSDSGYGTVDGRSAYYDSNADGSTNIFPDGVPRGSHHQFPHDKMIVEQDGEVGYLRENGETTMDSREYGQ